MPNTTQLSEFEKGQIIAYKKCGKSEREIARKINRSKAVFYIFLKNSKEYGIKKRTGKPPTLTMRQKRAIANRACLR